jgi:4-diphosphocytidyl-2C-methyl-D-erythritol kinase
MSGSGASVYGIFKNEINLKTAFESQFYFSCWL